MKCAKCDNEFPEQEIHISHDIPRYMGGGDSDGRHPLCRECHDKYEWDIIKIGIMNFVKGLSPAEKMPFRNAAKLVKRFFFKNKKSSNGNEGVGNDT